MKPYLLQLLFLITFYSASFGQCSLVTSTNQTCAGERVTVQFQTTSGNFTYQILVSSPFQSGPIPGDSIVFVPQGSSQDYLVSFQPMRRGALGGFTNCGNPTTVNVLATPDASLNFNTGTEGPNNLVKNCASIVGQSDFLLEISNGSLTENLNVSYTIDWGDGTPPVNTNEFTTLSHTYALGSFELEFTVNGEGNANCNPTTTIYHVFNGTSPSVGLIDLLNVAGPEHGCPPVFSEFQITEIFNNVVGTEYDIIIDGDTVMSFQHPPPPTFSWLFEETSCGHNASFPNTYEVRIEASNPCLAVPDFAILGPIIIGDSVKPDFTYSPDPICKNEVITFTNTTQGAINGSSCRPIINAAWSIEPATGWTLVSGNMESAYQIQVMFDDPGAYEVTIEAGNTCDTLEETKTLTVSEIPMANAIATLNDPDGCAPSIATFENLSTNDSSVTYTWTVTPNNGVSFINGTNQSSFEPTIQFNNAGNFNVTLRVSNDCGTPTWDTTLIINGLPNFQLNSIDNICADSYVYQSNINFSPNTDSVVWIFDGGDITNFTGTNPPPVTFAGSGDYSITVNAYSICGVNSQNISFNVSEPVDINAGDDFSICFNSPPMVLSGSPANGVWSGSGVTWNLFNPTMVSTTTATLLYTFDNGICFFVDTLMATIVSIPNLTAGPDQEVCINGSPIALTGQSPAGGVWFGNAVTNGQFDPALSAVGISEVGYAFTETTLGCIDTVFKNIEVIDIPTINFNLPDTICTNAALNFNVPLPAGADLNWDFGDGNSLQGNNINHSYSASGNYTIQLIVELNGCFVSEQWSITVIEAPFAAFIIDSPIQCNSSIIYFTQTTSGDIENQFWDFGNGLTSTATNPAGVQFNTGIFNDTSYLVTLTATNFCGSTSFSDSIFILKEPVALFGTDFQRYCQDQPVIINNSSYNSPESYWWDFGNGNTSTLATPPNQIYPTSINDTTYTITLVATNSCGSDTVQQNVIIKSVDVVSFFNTSNRSGCAPLEIEFTSFSSVGASLFWDFGDGNVSNEDTITHIYQNAGNYEVMLAVDNGCSKDTSYVDIEVLQGPNVRFEIPAVVCQHETFQVLNTTTGASGYSWDFGDGTISSLNQPNKAFLNAGFFNVTLTAESANFLECSSVLTKTIEVKPAPIAEFEVETNTTCLGTLIQFTNLSEGSNFVWDFGDGNISMVENPEYSYSIAGSYDVQLIVNIDNFCFDTITKPGIVEVFEVPTANFNYSQNPDQVIYGEVSFENLSSVDANTFVWDFGDGTMQSTDENPIHTFMQSGQQIVTLSVSNSFGCTDTIVKPIGVEFFGKLFVPNAMSPILGEQTQASMFLPKGVGLAEYELEIYSTYGEMLWRTTALSEGQPVEGWDGTFKGKPMPQDNYVWKIIAKFDNGLMWQGLEYGGNKFNTMGTFVLIR
jgi:PKD repeat protein